MKFVRTCVQIVLAAALMAWPTGVIGQEIHTLRLANFASATGAGGLLFEAYAKELEAASDGRLKVELFHGASLGPGPKHFDLIKSGVADLGYFAAFYTPGRFPMSDIFSLPNVISNVENDSEATKLLMKLAPEYLLPEYEGVRIIWLAAASQDRIYSTGEPIRTLEDIKGKRLRVTAKSAQTVLRQVGAVPVSMPSGEVAESLQKNSLDGVHTSRAIIWALKLGDLVRYQTPLLKVHLVAGFAINEDSYDRLPADLQGLVDGLGGTDGAVRYIRSLAEDNPLVNDYLADKAIEAVEPDPSLVKAVSEAADAFNENALAAIDAEKPELRQLYNRIRELDGAAN